MVKIAIILINYKQPQLTLECIKSIKQTEDYNDYKIIVVDNNSNDNSIKLLSQEKDIILIKSDENKGFSAGNNIGIRYAIENNFDAVMLLNNDTIIDKSLLRILLNSYSEEKVLLPKMYYYDKPDTIWYGGGHINYIKAKGIHENENKKDGSFFDCDHEIDFMTGCCALIPLRIIEMVGYLDEKFFMYCEDFDYSIRLKKNGVKMKYIANAKLWHKIGASTNKRSNFNVYYDTRNRLMIMNDYNFNYLAYFYFYISRFVRVIQSLFRGDSQYKYIVRGMYDFYRDIKGKVEL